MTIADPSAFVGLTVSGSASPNIATAANIASGGNTSASSVSVTNNPTPLSSAALSINQDNTTSATTSAIGIEAAALSSTPTAIRFQLPALFASVAELVDQVAQQTGAATAIRFTVGEVAAISSGIEAEVATTISGSEQSAIAFTVGDLIVGDFAVGASLADYLGGVGGTTAEPDPETEQTRVILINHSMSAKRVSDNAAINVLSVAIRSSRSSYCHDIDLTLGSAADLALIENTGSPVEIEIEIDGFRWRALAEGQSTSIRFGSRSYTASARGLSCELGSPYATPRSWSNNATTTAGQAIQAELDRVGGWSLDFRLTDWAIPAGALSYLNQTPIQAIGRIAAAGGGIIQTDREARTLIVQASTRVPAWRESSEVADRALSGDLILAWSEQYQQATAFDAVFCRGEQQGVECKVVRQGTAGTRLAPGIVDALITATTAAQQRGESVLADAVSGYSVSMAIPVQLGGALLAPGESVLVDVLGDERRVRVDQVNIEAALSERSISVRQSVGATRFEVQP